MSISAKKIKLRLKYHRPEAKSRACQRRYYKSTLNPDRYLSRRERELIVEMTKILALKMRLQALWTQIAKLGGKKGRGHWLDDVVTEAQIKRLYKEKNKANKELSELKPFAEERGAANYTPHEIAQTLNVSLRLVYLTLRMFAWTGEVKFSRDRRSHENPAKADNSAPSSEGQNIVAANTSQAEQRACNGLTPYPAPTSGKDLPSPRKQVTPVVKQSMVVFVPKSLDYRRDEMSDDMLPACAKIRMSSRPKIMSGMELVRHCYKLNIADGLIPPLHNVPAALL